MRPIIENAQRHSQGPERHNDDDTLLHVSIFEMISFRVAIAYANEMPFEKRPKMHVIAFRVSKMLARLFYDRLGPDDKTKSDRKLRYPFSCCGPHNFASHAHSLCDQ